jgi:hypothetical protein
VTASLSEAAKQETRTAIVMATREPAYLQANHKDHKRAVENVTGLYQKLNSE